MAQLKNCFQYIEYQKMNIQLRQALSLLKKY